MISFDEAPARVTLVTAANAASGLHKRRRVGGTVAHERSFVEPCGGEAAAASRRE